VRNRPVIGREELKRLRRVLVSAPDKSPDSHRPRPSEAILEAASMSSQILAT
jgi:hypothetical protein